MEDSPSTSTSSTKAATKESCRVCGAPSYCAHLGINSCRACAAFFRRIANAETRRESLKCQRDASCALKGSSTGSRLCKKCRYKRCIAVGMKEEVVGKRPAPSISSLSIPKKMKAVEPSYIPYSEELLQRSAASLHETPLLHWIHDAYQILSKGRRIMERSLLPLQECEPNELWQGRDEVLRPCRSIQRMNDLLVRTIPMLQKFIDAICSEIETLDSVAKGPFVREIGTFFIHWEVAFKSARNMGSGLPDRNKQVSVTTYLKTEEVEREFERKSLGSEQRALLEMAISRSNQSDRIIVHEAFRKLDMDFYEFGAFMANAMWTIEPILLDSHRAGMRSRNRETLFRELHRYYRSVKGLSDYAGRIGEIMNLIVQIQREIRDKTEQRTALLAFDVFDREAFSFFHQ